MNEELRIIIRAVTEEAKRNVAAVRKEIEGIQQSSQESSKKVDVAMKAIGKSVVAAVAVIATLTTAMATLGKAANEVQKGFAKLNTTFMNAGMSASQASNVYKDLFGFLGEHDEAIEAAQSLALITSNEKDLAEWTNILQGAFAEMGTKLPIDSLAEAANETINVGQVVGVMADALTWAGISEDGFNQALAQTTSLSEREALVRNTLNGLYGNSAKIYSQLNQSTIAYNKSQADLNIALANTSAYVTPLLTSLNVLSSTMLTALAPAIQVVSLYLTAFIQLIAEAIVWVANFFGILGGGVETTTADIKGYQNAMNSYLQNLQGGFSGTNTEIKDTINNVNKLKRATMGFDELNVVSNPASGGSVSVPDIGGGGGGGTTLTPPNPADYGIGENTLNLEEFKTDLEEAKGHLKVVAAILGTIASIIGALKLHEIFVYINTLLTALFGKGKAASTALKSLDTFGTYIVDKWGVIVGFFAKFQGIFVKIGAAIASAAKAVAAFIGGLSAGAIAVIIAIIAAIAAAVYFLVKNWDELGQSVKNFFDKNIAPKFEKIGESLGKLWDAIKSVGQAFADLGLLIWNALPEGVRDWFVQVAEEISKAWKAFVDWLSNIDWSAIWQGFLTVIEWIGGFVVGILGGVIGGAINALVGVIQGLVEFITGVVQVIAGIVGGLVNLIVALFTGDFSKAKDSVQLIVDGIVSLFEGLYHMTIGAVVDLVKGIIDWFVEMWDVLVGHSIVPDTIEAIIDWFFQLPQQLFKMLGDFVKGVIDFFKDLATKAGTSFSNMVTNIKKPFQNIASWFKDVFSKAWENVKNVFSKGGKIFDGIKDGILNGLKAIVNGLIGGINKVIAAPFNGLNSALRRIKGISIAGIKPFDWIQTLSVPQIPQLATGGITYGATLAMIGERGKEAVLPLENNTGWMDILADRIAARNNAPTKVVLAVDGRELGYATINSINDITRQTGSLQLTLV